MKRDMVLCRAILLNVRDRSDCRAAQVEMPDADPLMLSRMVDLLAAEGFLDVRKERVNSTDPGRSEAFVTDLTWKGHDFIDALEKNGVWDRLKAKFTPAELATIPLDVIKATAISAAAAYVKAQLGG